MKPITEDTYFAIEGKDYSHLVNELKVSNIQNFNAQTNAAGDTVIDYINKKREIEVGFIPLSDKEMSDLLYAIDTLVVGVSFRNPQTNQLEEMVICMIPDSNVEYYTIQSGRVMYKALTLTFTEL
jgi:hypothetical protein